MGLQYGATASSSNTMYSRCSHEFVATIVDFGLPCRRRVSNATSKKDGLRVGGASQGHEYGRVF